MTANTAFKNASGLYEIHAGFIPLTDCAPLVIAKEMGFDRAHGVDLVLHKEVSWANIRDKAEAAVFDCAIMLAPMPLASTLGLGPSHHGQRRGLSRAHQDAGHRASRPLHRHRSDVHMVALR